MAVESREKNLRLGKARRGIRILCWCRVTVEVRLHRFEKGKIVVERREKCWGSSIGTTIPGLGITRF